MQPLEIDSAVFCDCAHYTIISRENSSILICPVTSGAGGYALNRVEGRDIDREIGGLTGHAACIAVDVPTWCRIAGDPLDAVADALADLLDETPTRFELEQLAAASPLLKANTPGIPVFPGGIAPAHRPGHAGPRRQEGRGLERAGRGRRARAGALGRRFPFGNTRSHGRAPTLSSGQYPLSRRFSAAAPLKELRHGAHRPRI